jgi:hypothetical protein
MITDAFRQLLAELAEEGVDAPLHRPLPLYAIWADLCRLAGEQEPPEVAAIVDAPAATPLRPGPARFIPAAATARN